MSLPTTVVDDTIPTATPAVRLRAGARRRSQRAHRGRSYTSVAAFYEAIAHGYSGGCIAATKRSQLAEMQPGDRVLYVGVGAGEDASEAAGLGLHLTCLDLSSAMLARLESRLANQGRSAEIICGNAFDHNRFGYYDVVTANFLLNCLSESAARQLLAHLATLLRPGGKLLIADLAVPRGNLLYRSAQRLYSRAANIIFWSLGLVPLHPIYDYTRWFDKAGLKHLRTRPFRLGGCGPVAYESIAAVRINPPR